MNDYNRKNGLLYTVLYILLIIPLFKPNCISALYPSINSFYNYYLILSAVVITTMYFINCRISKNMFLLMLFLLILFFSTVINKGDIYSCLLSILKTLSISFLIDFSISKKSYRVLQAFEFVLSTLVYINFLSLFIYPNGMYISNVSGYYHNWFLGFKNIHILYILPAILFSYLNDYLKDKNSSLKTKTLIFVSTISIVKVWSATGLVGLFLILLFSLFQKKIVTSMLFSLKNYIIFTLSAFFGVVILRIQNLFKYFIVDVLKKDLTFTGRVYIWDYVLRYIARKPILGYGFEKANFRYLKGTNPHSYHAHNVILELVYKTGFVGLTIIILIFKDCYTKLNEFRLDRISKLLSFWMFIYMVITLTEAYDFELFFYIFTLASNIKNIILIRKGCLNEN